MLTTPQANAPIPNELEWISTFLSFEREITGDDIENIRNFSILWNLFEGLVCNKNASVAVLENAVSDLHNGNKLRLDDYDKFLKYFSNRYIESGETNHRFERLNLRQNDKPELVEAVLKGNETAPVKVLLALLIIVYRYRNNLFHGEKSIYDLPNQVDNFRNANQLLMVFMEKWNKPIPEQHGCRDRRARRETVQGAGGQGGDDVRAAYGEGEVGVSDREEKL